MMNFMQIPPKCGKCGCQLKRYNASDKDEGIWFYISACPKCFEIKTCKPTGCFDNKNLKFMQGFWKRETGE